MKSAASITRRSVLGATVLGLAACKHEASAVRRPDPDASALDALVSKELALLAATTDPAEHAAHVQHLTALGAVSRRSQPPNQPAGSRRSLLRKSVASLREAATNAVSGAHAATWASIAASHEVMARD